MKTFKMKIMHHSQMIKKTFKIKLKNKMKT